MGGGVAPDAEGHNKTTAKFAKKLHLFYLFIGPRKDPAGSIMWTERKRGINKTASQVLLRRCLCVSVCMCVLAFAGS